MFDNMSPEAMTAWDTLVSGWGEPLKVNSAYRDPSTNKRVGGAKRSQHMHGNAFDIDVASLPQDRRLQLIEQARGAGFRGIGVYNNALHVDVGPDRAWGPDYHRGSLPEWAAGAVGAPVGGNVASAAPQQRPNALGPAAPAPQENMFSRLQALQAMRPQTNALEYGFRMT